MTLVMYNQRFDRIALWVSGDYWLGPEYVAWRRLDTAIEYGWEVIGEL